MSHVLASTVDSSHLDKAMFLFGAHTTPVHGYGSLQGERAWVQYRASPENTLWASVGTNTTVPFPCYSRSTMYLQYTSSNDMAVSEILGPVRGRRALLTIWGL